MPSAATPGFFAPIAESIWNSKYRLTDADGTAIDTSLTDTFARVARAAASLEKGGTQQRRRWEKRYFDALSDFGFLPGGRILAGAGANRDVTLFNCFVMGPVPDDLAGIFEGVRDGALTMQMGGGIGIDFSTLRPRGALVKSIGADASGPVSFMEVWDAMCRTIMSAGARRGAMMATLRDDHPDIEEFIEAKAAAGRLTNFNLSVLVSDKLMAAVAAGADWELTFGGKVYRRLPARELWQRIMRATYEQAEPGVIFIDRVNANNNLAYCETIHATNPCVTADTWVMTAAGARQVAELIGTPFEARVNGRDWQSGPRGFFPTGRKRVLRIEAEDGQQLTLTADHPVLKVVRRTRWSLETEWSEAGKLASGDEVVIHDHGTKEWPGPGTQAEGYLLGLLVGDGTMKQDKTVISVWRPAIAVNAGQPCGVDAVMRAAEAAARTLPHRSDFAGWIEVPGRNEWRLSSGALRRLARAMGLEPGRKTATAEIERSSSAFHAAFLRGLFDADGSVQGSQSKGVSVRLSASNLDLLQAVQRMLARLGIIGRIYAERRPAGQRLLPDGRGGRREYGCAANHELVIAGANLLRFAERVGFVDAAKSARLTASLGCYRRAINRERFVAKIARLSEAGEQEVFDCEVPGINAFDANGFYVHNCGEQPLPPFGACLLGSLNLTRFIDNPFSADARLDVGRLQERTAVAVRFLDNMIDRSRYPLAAQRFEAKAKRRMGLGVTGLADALIMCGETYGSAGALQLTETWTGAIEEAAYRASIELAGERGSFPLFDAKALLQSPNIKRLPADIQAGIETKGLRNGCLTTVAPTGTISLFAGNVSSGIEPVFDFVYERRLLDRHGGTRREIVEDYAHALFRRQFGDDQELPESFVRADQLPPRAHLEMQAAVQRHVDSSISKTINCPPEMTFEAFSDVYSLAYELGLKGCTTYRPSGIRGAVLSRSADAQSGAGEKDTAPKSMPAAGAGSSAETPMVREDARGGAIHYMSKPLEREPALQGYTYKLKWPGSDHALYITINDIVRDGRRRPFEIFINTKNLEHYAWTVALTRMISAVFRRGGDVAFVAEELTAIFDPQGGRWIGGRYVPSLLAAIGEIIDGHMRRIGFLPADGHGQTEAEAELELLAAAGEDAPSAATIAATSDARGEFEAAQAASRPPRQCPKCGFARYVRLEGCWICQHCGFSRCD